MTDYELPESQRKGDKGVIVIDKQILTVSKKIMKCSFINKNIFT